MNWDERYAVEDWLFGRRPTQFIVEQSALLRPGAKVLAVGDGEGRNGVWLARQGMDVTSIDISPNAVAKAKRLAREYAVKIDALCGDVDNWSWPLQEFDAIICIFVHLPPETRARLHRRIINALAPDGILLLEAFHTRQLSYGNAGPTDIGMLYDEALIEKDFAALECCQLTVQETRVYKLGEKEENGCSVQFVGRRKLIN